MPDTADGGWTVGTLKEHRDQRITTLAERTDEKFATRDEALALQATEYERRLSDLNHAHEQARQKEADYVTRDKYEDSKLAEAEALKLALQASDARLNALENWRSRTIGAALVLTLLAGALGAAIVRAFGG